MKVRVISGIVLTVIMIAALLLGGWVLFALTLGISLIGMYEIYRVVGQEKSLPAVFGYMSAIFYYVTIGFGLEQFSVLAIVLGLMSIMAVYVFTFPKYKATDMIMLFFGIVYVAMMLSYMYKVRVMEDGIFLVWLIFVSAWVNDTLAYFSGVLLGKHKMTPKLSPKKTIEGAVGGILGATLVGAVYGYIVGANMNGHLGNTIIAFAVASFVGAFLAIVGDLAASAIKRNHDIKDYGNLIPGHGGILDRFDSVIFTAPAVYWALMVIGSIMG
ncbi:MAG: phosphatidate cytidylyltransferase [Lachnospira sp.]|nr:phosphatidate cytidylyltransferase [Lachnospira sp.]